MISYEPLWETMKKKDISQYQLINKYKFSAGQLSRMRANQNVSTNTLVVLCEILDCEIQDVACIKRNKNNKNE
jgi:DNA-binding Xre family transcriptional regulator